MRKVAQALKKKTRSRKPAKLLDPLLPEAPVALSEGDGKDKKQPSQIRVIPVTRSASSCTKTVAPQVRYPRYATV